MPDKFNEPQRSRILAGVSYIDRLLVDVDQILTASSSPAFPKYKDPLTPAQVRVVRNYANRLRQQIVHVLNDLNIDLPPPKFDCTHAMRVALQFIEVAVEELAPERLRGYGEMPRDLFPLLSGGLQEMKGIVRQMDSYLVQRADVDLNLRAAQFSDTGDLGDLLSTLARIVDQYGFVEFRALLSGLCDRIATPRYEIAFFGRVSAGKSSLLNCIIGTDVLPTGVTPVTAIPTRIRNRPEPGLLVWTAEGRLTRCEIERLPDFVTEQQNPGNCKCVARLIVEVPLAALPEEIVFVDTPGLGSLALEGATETLAYLPECDLAVLLIDASSSIQADDVATLEALRAASVPSVLVISKADLLSADDLERLLSYTRDRVSKEFRTQIAVAPLSSRPKMKHLLAAWVRNEITPRIANARELAWQSNLRKAHMLGLRVLHGLETSVNAAHPAGRVENRELKDAETRLREAASIFESTSEECFRITGQTREAAAGASAALVEKALDVLVNDSTLRELTGEWIQKAFNSLAQNEAEALAGIVLRAAERWSEALDKAAKATAATDRVETTVLQRLVKDLPVPEFPVSSIRLQRPRLASVSAALARHSLQHQLASQGGTAVGRFFDSYGRALELWFRNTLSILQRDFDATAEIYRAQLQRLMNSDRKQELDGEALPGDISLLSRMLGRADMVERVESHANA